MHFIITQKELALIRSKLGQFPFNDVIQTIAVIDGGYNLLNAAIIAGDAPGGATQTNYTSTTFQAVVDGRHGTGCTEAAFDHCPGANWRLYKIDGLTDMLTAVEDACANDVDIITHSLSRSL